jgi:chromosome segregation ATPase
MEKNERDEAVEEHLGALDDEIARLRKMEAAMDRRIAAAEEERRALEDATRPPDERL